MMINKQRFCEIIKRLKDYTDLQDKINELFKNQIDNREMDFMNAGSICIGHESVVIELLENMFETDMVSWWIYETDFGRTFSLGDVEEGDGYKPDLSTASKLYDYLIYNLEEENNGN